MVTFTHSHTHIHQELWFAALEAFSGTSSPGAVVLSQLMVPGQLCLSSLCQALAAHGAALTETEAASASQAQLAARISGAVELIRARAPTHGLARCWHSLFASYCQAWSQQHGALALFGAPGGWIGCVRAGGLATVLRRPTPAESLLSERRPKALGQLLQSLGSHGTSGVPGGAAAVSKVFMCLCSIGGMLGQPALRLMTHLAMEGERGQPDVCLWAAAAAFVAAAAAFVAAAAAAVPHRLLYTGTFA